MKKAIVFSLAGLLAMMLVGCGGGEETAAVVVDVTSEVGSSIENQECNMSVGEHSLEDGFPELPDCE